MKKVMIYFASGVMSLLLLALGSYIFLEGVAAESKDNPPQRVTTALTVNKAAPSVDKLLSLTNAERSKHGLALLTLDPMLNNSAKQKADDMVKFNYFDHVNPNTGMRGGQYALDATGKTCSEVSENLRQNVAMNNTSEAAIEGLMNSQSHREAILNERYDTVGFGVNGLDIVQHFCDKR